MMRIILHVGAERKPTRPEAMDTMESDCEAILADRMDPRLCAARGHAGNAASGARAQRLRSACWTPKNAGFAA